MGGLFRLVRSTVFLGWMCVAFAASTVALGVQALTLSAQVAVLSANAAVTALRHRKELSRAVARTKAKARLRRAVVAIPFVGGGALVYFEQQDFADWQRDNPDGTFGDYSCEMSALSAELMDDVLQGLPAPVRPPRETLVNQMPECEAQS